MKKCKRRARQGKTGAPKVTLLSGLSEDVRLEIKALVWLLFTALTVFSLWGKLGNLGDLWALTLHWGLGTVAWLVPVASLFLATLFLVERETASLPWRQLMVGALLFSLTGLFHASNATTPGLLLAQAGVGGGYLGLGLTNSLFYLIGQAGTTVVYAALSLIFLLLALNVSLRRLFLGRPSAEDAAKTFSVPEAKIVTPSFVSKNIAKLRTAALTGTAKKGESVLKSCPKQERLLPDDKASSATKSQKAVAVPVTDTAAAVRPKTGWQLPSLDLLTDVSFVVEIDEKHLQKQATIIGQTLADFGIAVEMKGVNVGPTVVQYTLKPATGIKLSRIIALQNDLALALAAESIRIEAPIPGQSLVGIEIPAKKRAEVGLRGLLDSPEFKADKGPLTFAIGRDVSGKPVVGSLTQMPHLLIAGATGSGKSVCINALLLSLLCNHSPDEFRLILIDPKRVELNIYNHIPHLLAPVIVNAKRTISALRWAVAEMNRRYRLLADARCKNIAEYNKANRDESLYYIVIVIDELADLMMLAAKEVEALVCRLAQMARAVGIHMALATQRPSVDVITGLIKANMPVRFAFTVVSQTDSRTIIDQGGAEKLLGRGDMLYISAELPKPKRVQGVFVGTEEVKRIVADLKLTARPEYNVEITDKQQPVPEGIPANKVVLKEGVGDGDLEKEAIQVICQTKKASASLLQRFLKVGYARAARILDELEQKGVVGPAQGSKPRRILIDLPAGGGQGSEEIELGNRIDLNTKAMVAEDAEEAEDADEMGETAEIGGASDIPGVAANTVVAGDDQSSPLASRQALSDDQIGSDSRESAA